MTIHHRRRVSIAFLGLLCLPAFAADWPEWGGSPSRNMASTEKGLPADFQKPADGAGGKNVAWVAKVGSQLYGNPTVAGGRIYLGTNNDSPRDPRFVGDLGMVFCLNEADGKLVWQLPVPKLPGGAVVDADNVGVCSSPAADADRVFVVTSRCEVLCLDAKGMANGNDGPYKNEGEYFAGPGKPPIESKPTDADIIWCFNMYDELGIFPHQMTSSSPLVVGDKLYVATSNGVDWTRQHKPNPSAPALICLDKSTGKLLGQERSGIGHREFKCGWSSPSFAEIHGKPTVIYGADDGFCYGFAPEPAADGSLTELWRFDCNPPEYRKQKYGTSKGPSGVLATPVAWHDRIYVAIGQDPENGDGVGRLSCIDVSDPTNPKAAWTFDKISRSMSTVSIGDGLLYVADFSGRVYCLDADTGKVQWDHDTQSAVWGSTLLADGKLYVGNEDRYLFTFAAGREKKLIAENELTSPVYATPVAANGVLYVGTSDELIAVRGAGK